jgi:general secretion pathway protein J
MRKTKTGFTLLEILVVLVLTSFITGILLQGLQQVYRIQVRFGTEMFHSQQRAMRVDWYRSSINGIMPDYVDGKCRFRGGARMVSGQTTAPLDAIGGALVPFKWRIDFDPKAGEMALYSGDGSDAVIVLTWPGSEGRFLYVDEDSHAQESWPPLFGKPQQVPRMILLEMGAAGKADILVSVPRGPDRPWPKKSDVLKNL